MMLHPAYLWLIAGGFFLALEAFGVTGVGFLFAGFAAFCVGVLVHLQAVAAEGYGAQFACFFALTAMWAALLWKPLRRFQLGRGRTSEHYSNIVGETAVVGAEGLRAGQPGEVRWSGTVMRAELAAGAQVAELPADAQVTITGIKGATLFVVPKQGSSL